MHSDRHTNHFPVRHPKFDIWVKFDNLMTNENSENI